MRDRNLASDMGFWGRAIF